MSYQVWIDNEDGTWTRSVDLDGLVDAVGYLIEHVNGRNYEITRLVEIDYREKGVSLSLQPTAPGIFGPYGPATMPGILQQSIGYPPGSPGYTGPKDPVTGAPIVTC